MDRTKQDVATILKLASDKGINVVTDVNAVEKLYPPPVRRNRLRKTFFRRVLTDFRWILVQEAGPPPIPNFTPPPGPTAGSAPAPAPGANEVCVACAAVMSAQMKEALMALNGQIAVRIQAHFHLLTRISGNRPCFWAEFGYYIGRKRKRRKTLSGVRSTNR